MDALALAQVTDWTLSAAAIPGGVRLQLAAPAQAFEGILALGRQEARAFAHSLLEAASDATFRTIPHPHEGAERG